ncbi:hypothetical protein, partial [Clostridium lundense]|uniref:hypothetical protein n=1 Tax=Clostridium lundense TaxID=319475 RepID=UPI001A9A3ABC
VCAKLLLSILGNTSFDFRLADETISILSRRGIFFQRLSFSEHTCIAGGFIYRQQKQLLKFASRAVNHIL